MVRYALIAGIAVLSAAAVLLAGCANTIREPAAPAETRSMYLLDLGRHTHLAFGLPDGDFVEYGYGEWLWYARMEDQWWRVPAVLFWPTQGTLGRRYWRGRDAEARLLEEYAGLSVLALPAAQGLVSSIVAILCSAPDRISEVLHLEADCEASQPIPSTGEVAYGLRWQPAKGADPTVKWVIPSMADVVKEAVANIKNITEPARQIARWYETHPGEVHLPQRLEHLRRCERITLDQVGEIVFSGPVKRGSDASVVQGERC